MSKPSSRSPHGERGLKFRQRGRVGRDGGRSPHGERGLKSVLRFQSACHARVALLTEIVD